MAPHEQDDPTIGDSEVLWRRILPRDDWKTEDSAGNVRPSSAAFRDDLSGEISVHIAALTSKETVLDGHPDHSIASITARDARDQGYLVVRRPEADDPSHALLIPGPQLTPTSVIKRARKLAKAAKWV